MNRQERRAERWRLYKQFFRLIDSYDGANIDLAIAMMAGNQGLRDVAKNRYYPILRALDSSVGGSWASLKQVRERLADDKDFRAKFVLRYAMLGEVETALALVNVRAADFTHCKGLHQLLFLALLEEQGHEAVSTEIEVVSWEVSKDWSWSGGYYDKGNMYISIDSKEMQRILGLTVRHLRHAKRLRSQWAEVGAYLDSFTELRELELTDCELKELPDALWGLLELRELSLYSNELCRLPSELKAMQNLMRLSISRNPIKTLPDWLFDLPKLQDLNASYCELGTVELKSPPKATGLKKLNLIGNPWKKRPKKLKKVLNSLLYVYL